jgi:hypothetical protein
MKPGGHLFLLVVPVLQINKVNSFWFKLCDFFYPAAFFGFYFEYFCVYM